jgi:hypothetical protein
MGVDETGNVCALSRNMGVAKSKEHIPKVVDFGLQTIYSILQSRCPSQITRRVVDTIVSAFLLAGGTCRSFSVALGESLLGQFRV